MAGSAVDLGPYIVTSRPMPDHIQCRLILTDLRDLSTAISTCRWLLDLDADPVAVDERLCRDRELAPHVRKEPGRRVARTVERAEFACPAGERGAASAA